MAKVPNSSENSSRCICTECPSYSKEGGFYCATGKSEAPVREKGCICGDCEVYKDYELADAYYCMNGVAG